MSPYMQNVVDIQKRTAEEEFDRQQARDRMSRVTSGARGGYREALQEMLGGAQQAQVMSDIQAKGSQAAFELSLIHI